MAVHLSKRMEALARMVTPGNRLCDVGCDHGFLPIYLVEQKLIPSALAMDIGEGPLLAAKTHIAEAGLETVIATRRSDGLAQVKEDETDTILIAGMGGGIVIHILTEGRSVARMAKELILQPQSELEEVRRFLFSENYELLQEDMVLEDGKYYPMMKVSQQKAAEQTKILPQEVADAFGPVLLQKRHPVLKEWLERELRTTNSVIEQLSAQPDHERIRNRMQQVNCKKTLILEALKNYGTESVQSDD